MLSWKQLQPHHALQPSLTEGCLVSDCVATCPCRYLLEYLGVTQNLLTCFSNRLLARLRNATATVEALMGVAFQWEAAVRTHLATGNNTFVPTRGWFEQRFLRTSQLYRFIQGGVNFIAFDEAWTLHPLVLDCFVAAAHEYGVVTFSVGEALQITARTDEQWVARGWHSTHGFTMPYWQQLQQQGQVLFLHLTTNHRLCPHDAGLLRRVRTPCQPAFLVFCHMITAPAGT